MAKHDKTHADTNPTHTVSLAESYLILWERNVNALARGAAQKSPNPTSEPSTDAQPTG